MREPLLYSVTREGAMKYAHIPEVAVAAANYNTARQLMLDLNQSPAVRQHWENQFIFARRKLDDAVFKHTPKIAR